MNDRPVSGEPVHIHDGDQKITVCCECGLAHFHVYKFKLKDGEWFMEMITYVDAHETNLARAAMEAVGERDG